MKILFAGTPEIGIPSLVELNKHYEICGVLTNPDRPKGRKKKLHPSPIKASAIELNLEIFQPEKLNEDFYSQIKQLQPDILVCIAYGKIFKQEFLDLFPYGGVNIHPSLLPKYRGSSPLNSAILNGDKVSGISIQRLAKKMDSGNILLQEKFNIDETDTTGSLISKVGIASAPLIKSVIDSFINGTINEYEQNDSAATFCKLINKSDGIINWSENSVEILNKIRAYNPWPIAHTVFDGKTLNILEAKMGNTEIESEPGKVLSFSKSDGYLIKTGDGALFVTYLQLQSKKALDYKSFNNGVQNFVDTILG